MSKNKFETFLNKMREWPRIQKAYVTLWLLTGILLIIVIVLMVVYQTPQTEQVPITLPDGTAGKAYTDQALMYQNIVNAMTFIFVITMTAAIFTLVASIIMKRKTNKQTGKALKEMKHANPA